MSPTPRRYEQPNMSYRPSKSKNSHFCHSRTKNCNFGQQSRRFGQNVRRKKSIECVQEALCQFSGESFENFGIVENHPLAA